MLKDIYQITIIALPVMIVTFFASEMLDDNYAEIKTLREQIIDILFDYGDYIIIEGTGKWDGVYQVRDTMNPKWTNRVDILTTNSRFKYNNITMYKYVDETYIVANN